MEWKLKFNKNIINEIRRKSFLLKNHMNVPFILFLAIICITKLQFNNENKFIGVGILYIM